MYVNMDKRPRNRKPLGAARDLLHRVIRGQKAATEELLATNRELEKLLAEVLAGRADLRDQIEAVEPEDNPSPPKPSADPGRSIGELRREVDSVLDRGGQAIRESASLRRRSSRLRELLRHGGAPGAAFVPTQGGLSKREHQVLTLIVQGKSSKQIAAELGISFKTAVTHRASIMSKLDVHEIASVVREAIRRGMV